MPFRRRRFNRFRRRGGRRRFGGQVGPSLRRTRWTFKKRVAQNITREVRWFKYVGVVTSNALGRLEENYSTGDVGQAKQFDSYTRIWEEYKVLQVSVKWFPANVGGESQQQPPGGAPGPPPGAPLLQRGDCVTWCDPNTPSLYPTGGITDIMGKSSARLINPRRQHKRWINRPKGYPKWGLISPGGVVTTPDAWPGSISMYGDNFTPIQAPGTQQYFYAQVMFKVLFRSRQDE